MGAWDLEGMGEKGRKPAKIMTLPPCLNGLTRDIGEQKERVED